jgi:cell shape-determining protein MreD
MTPRRAAAALAGIVTALVLQATLVAPVSAPLPVSLPAVIVAAVALVSGPGTGLCLGFVAGLLADLGSDHPAGVLAACWLAIGISCGIAADVVPRGRRAALAAGAIAGVWTVVAELVLTGLGRSGQTLLGSVRDGLPAALADMLLAWAVLPIVTAMLRSDVLRPLGARPARSVLPFGGPSPHLLPLDVEAGRRG